MSMEKFPKDNPCSRDCPERSGDCHATCKAHNDYWKAQREKEEAARAAKQREVRTEGFTRRKNAAIYNAARKRNGMKF